VLRQHHCSTASNHSRPRPSHQLDGGNRPDATVTPFSHRIGGADKIAYILANNSGTANVDGSEQQQVTSVGTVKKDLRCCRAAKACRTSAASAFRRSNLVVSR